MFRFAAAHLVHLIWSGADPWPREAQDELRFLIERPNTYSRTGCSPFCETRQGEDHLAPSSTCQSMNPPFVAAPLGAVVDAGD